ncbi:unnamed protein product [Amoebophrya sp. A25]|nr:unnamed protein product [Amoebophrya sp. A25]|eukprot:GSA25T00005150001.1
MSCRPSCSLPVGSCGSTPVGPRWRFRCTSRVADRVARAFRFAASHSSAESAPPDLSESGRRRVESPTGASRAERRGTRRHGKNENPSYAHAERGDARNSASIAPRSWKIGHQRMGGCVAGLTAYFGRKARPGEAQAISCVRSRWAFTQRRCAPRQVRTKFRSRVSATSVTCRIMESASSVLKSVFSMSLRVTKCICVIVCSFRFGVFAYDYDVSEWSSWPALAGMRCQEIVDFYPIGSEGGNWTDDVGREAVSLCMQMEECTGIMKYVGDDEAGTWFWQARPQFCAGSEVESITVEGKADEGSKQQTEGTAYMNRAETKKNHDWVTIFKPSYLFRGCPEKYPQCSVAADPWHLPKGNDSSQYDWIYTTSQDKIPFFARNGNRVHLDLREFTGKGLGASQAKTGFMSVWFDHYDALCPGGIDIHMAIEEIGLGDVFIDDGTPGMRKQAFGPYQFTFFCGENIHNHDYPPQSLVDTLVFGTLPLVPYDMYKDLAKFHFHLPDAVQGVRRLRLKSAEDYLSDLAGNPEKEELMSYKQTFLLVMQNLLAYRYRALAPDRLAHSMCQLCGISENDKKRKAAEVSSGSAQKAIEDSGVTTNAASGGGDGGYNKDGEQIKYGIAIMSRRSQSDIRAGVRRTWASWIRQKEHFFERWTTLRMGQVDYRFFVGKRGPENDNEVDSELDVEEVGVAESYRTINVKALSMVARALEIWPRLTFLLRCDDDIYLRLFPMLYHLERRTPVMYWWGNFDHGSNVVRNATHPHYNTFEQLPEQVHPMWGDVFPLYARGSLWIMSSDLVTKVVEAFRNEEQMSRTSGDVSLLELARSIPHPDDPMLGIFVENLVDRGSPVNVDDRDWNLFSLNPSCDAKFSMLHERTWVAHHLSPETMDCFFDVDMKNFTSFKTPVPLQRDLPSLCNCSMKVEEEDNGDWDELENLAPGQDHWYPRKRFNPELEFVDESDQDEDVATLDAAPAKGEEAVVRIDGDSVNRTVVDDVEEEKDKRKKRDGTITTVSGEEEDVLS